MELFNHNNEDAPLAHKLRPRTLDEFFGQNHLLENNSLLSSLIKKDNFSSLIFSGSPGSGKTSLAYLIAEQSKDKFIKLSAIKSTVQEVKKILNEAKERYLYHKQKTLLFLDELHRFNKSQQDILLQDIEEGYIRFIGATTHNPIFYIIPALVSRSHVFIFKKLSEKALQDILSNALMKLEVTLDKASQDYLITLSEGDARKLLIYTESLLSYIKENPTISITQNILASFFDKHLKYDNDDHYDTISAFIKSMRNSDADASIYYLAKMLVNEENISFIARRMMIFASEDIGNADPRALQVCVAASDAIEKVGMPEARIILANACTYCATAPKSNASYMAIEKAIYDVKNNPIMDIPSYLCDPNSVHYSSKEAYIYPHNEENMISKQQYLPSNKEYYLPKDVGYETYIKKRLEQWKKLKND